MVCCRAMPCCVSLALSNPRLNSTQLLGCALEGWWTNLNITIIKSSMPVCICPSTSKLKQSKAHTACVWSLARDWKQQQVEAFALCSSTHGAMWPVAHCCMQLSRLELGSAFTDPAGYFVSSMQVCLLWSLCHGSADRLLVQLVCVVQLSAWFWPLVG